MVRWLIISVMLVSLQHGSAQVTNFLFSSSPAVGRMPAAVIAADVNANGKLDLVSANAGDNTLTILTNDGDGAFGSNATLTVGFGPRSVAVADWNGDGKPDLVSANFDGDTLTVLTNNGTGAFGLNATLSGGTGSPPFNRVAPDSVATADVNGDGKPDLIWANWYTGTLSVFTNNGSGVLSSNATLTVDPYPISVAATDVNGDGKPDLACASFYAGTLMILTNNGSGIFGSNATYVVGGGPHSVTAADVNCDGKPDLISASEGNYLTILTNNGTGTFGSNTTLDLLAPVYVVTGDVNSDGKPDLICASPQGVAGGPDGDNSLTVFTNNGSGGFGLDGKLEVGGAPYSVIAADINRDGKLDLITANSSANTLLIFTNTIRPGRTGFTLISSSSLGTGGPGKIGPQSVLALDVNGDGKEDLAGVNFSAGTVTILTNNGNGQFGSNATLTADTGHPYAVTSVDVNGDGKPDLICANNWRDALTIFTNNGSGLFGSNAAVTINSNDVYNETFVVATDVNGDGKPDLICPNAAGQNGMTVFTNNGSGIFGSNVTMVVGSPPSLVVAADVNGDGKPDLISAGSGFTVFTNNGSGGFGLSATMMAGLYPADMAVADVNCDGKPDLIGVNFYARTLVLLTNNGSGQFGSNTTLNVGVSPIALAVADANHDGWPDLICLNPLVLGGLPPTGDNTLTIFTNDGTGGFGLNAKVPAGGSPYAVATADVNGDGRLDLIAAKETLYSPPYAAAYKLAVFLNVPLLDIHPEGELMSLTWPYPSSGFFLQQNPDLITTNWLSVTNPVHFVGGQNQVVLTPLTGNNFFRLFHPEGHF